MKSPQPPFSAAILAGGLSSRFGSNKALASFRGEPLIALQARVLAQLSDDLFVVANDAAAYGFLELAIYPDVKPGAGALSGIHAALTHARHERVFVAACDMPFLSPPLIRRIVELAGSHDAVVPESLTGPEPLHALYARSALPGIETALASGNVALRAVLVALDTHRVPLADVLWLTGGRDPFANVNTPDDYERLARGY